MAATPSEIDTPTCRFCRFRDRADRCRRNPPLGLEDPDSHHGWWPTIKLDDWCGEFRWTTEAKNFRSGRPALYDREKILIDISNAVPATFTELRGVLEPKYGMTEATTFKILRRFVADGKLARSGLQYHMPKHEQ